MRTATLAVFLLITPSTFAGEPAAITCLDDLVRMDECQLLDLYKSGKVGTITDGFYPGRAMPNPGGKLNVLRSKMMTSVWQGKYFDGDVMTNKFFGLKIIKGCLLEETSWIDGAPVHAIDYSHTSLLFKPYRDEFREICPGIYLGMMWKRDGCRPKVVSWFAFDTRGNCCMCGK